jgi:mono/diheme cytochrome c family protein
MFLDPYPRDFRRGTFKFKSTPSGSKPTTEDLQQVLRHGIPGTSMPSFQALEESEEFANDVEDLSQYVSFLAIRGEVERRMLTKLLRDSEPLTTESQWPLDILRSVVEKWKDAPNQALPASSIPSWITDPTESKERFEAIAKGKELFGSELTACSKCHGPSGLGDGASQDYDEWTKDWTVLAGIDPKQPGAWKVMKPFGALKPVIAKPRNLQWGGLHGGSDPASIYKRIVLGIEGTPMPPVARVSNSNPGLTEEEIWCLVGYVQELGRTQQISKSSQDQNAESSLVIRRGKGE